MEMVLILLRQITIMAFLVLFGIILSRKGLLSTQGTKDLGAILIRVIIPIVIIKSYIMEYSSERAAQLGQSFLLAFSGLVLAMAISWIVFGRKKKMENFASAFCNAGFIGIPLAQALIGSEGVFLIAAFIALLNLFQWTYGVYVMTGKREAISLKVILKNPVMIAIAVGLILFFTRIPIPEVVVSTLGYISGMNTPVAMILIGAYMARLSLKRILLERRAYLCVLFRLTVIPALTIGLYSLLPVQNKTVVLSSFLAAVTPAGANICVFAEQNNCDYELSVIIVCLSTILSIVTIPLFVSAVQLLWGS